MEKLLTITIPCFNSKEYMDKAIESLLHEKGDIEILIIDDGSNDSTGMIGDAYAKAYPETIRCLHQRNGGHGEAVNCGISYANGLYYKVLDSDDWFDPLAFTKVMKTLRALSSQHKNVDMFIANYVYEKISEHKQSIIHYRNVFPQNRIFSWKEIGHFHPQQNLLMHSVIYRTEVLRKANLKLPKHTFYVDNLFVFQPLPYVQTMYYLDVDLYRYYIGREGQSVQEQTMIKRIDQQLLVTKMMIDCMKKDYQNESKRYTYMVKYLTMILVVSSILLIRMDTEASLKQKEELWRYLKKTKPWLYQSVNHTLLGFFIQLNRPLERKILSKIYDISQKIFCFN